MPISDYVPPDTPTNNDYLTRIAGGVDPDATLDPRMTNNDLLRIIAEGTSGLAHLDSPALTGTPTAPTVDAGDESAQIATTEFVQREIAGNTTAIGELAASIAPVEGATALANYAVGDLLMRGNQLCKATSAIATGEAIVIGTNVSVTTVAEAIAGMELAPANGQSF